MSMEQRLARYSFNNEIWKSSYTKVVSGVDKQTGRRVAAKVIDMNKFKGKSRAKLDKEIQYHQSLSNNSNII